MRIVQGTVVTFHYTLTNDAGEVIDSSSGSEPFAYLHGMGNIIPGLERVMEGKGAGDKFNVSVEPAEAYGLHNEALVQDVPRSAFEGIANIEPGMRFQGETPEGPQMVVVTRVDAQHVTVDANHPLAGQRLTFDVEVTAVRTATDEEMEHGHVHGEGGHQHD